MSNKMIANAVRKLKGVWPAQHRKAPINYHDMWGNLYYGKDKSTAVHICSKMQFEKCLEKLQNKPKFQDHPDAKCFVQDHLGQWFKNILTADAKATPEGVTVWEDWLVSPTIKNSWVSVGKGEVIGDWRDTLTLPSKPEIIFKADSLVIENKVTGEVFDFSNSSAHLTLQQALSKGKLTAEELTAAQERTGKGLHSEVSTTNEADLWYINKELPPAGIECEYTIGERPKKTCTFVGLNSRGSLVIEDCNGEYKSYHNHQIKLHPIKSEREKFVEAAMKQAMAAYQSGKLCNLLSDDDFEHYFGQLFDSGEFFYKPKE